MQRFIPSEFSVDTDAAGPNHALSRMYKDKQPILQAVNASGLDYQLITPGLFVDLLLLPFCGVDVAALTVTAPYSLDTRVAFTSKPDIGRITAALLLSDLHRTRVNVCGDVMASDQILDTIERITGKTVQRNVWTAMDIEAAILAAGEAGLVKADIVKYFGEGK